MLRDRSYDYPYLRAWCALMHSADYYLEDQLAKARNDKAPTDAIYFGNDKQWHRFADVTNGLTRFQIESILDQRGLR